jgi:phage terminase large subunit GpA-like protein
VPLTEWAERKIRLPSGPFANRPYRHDRHPVSRPWLEALQSRKWQRFAITGPGQNGKSLLGFVIPTCYTLFELKETVFVGIPDMRLAASKWRDDFRPIIESNFPEMMPVTGEGSKGGDIKTAVRFRNGSKLQFLSAGQGDAGLAGFTTRNLIMTEVDKYDTASEISREADPIRQMEARTNAFARFGRTIIMECTVSIPNGRIWQEITNGTDSRPYHRCPSCGVWNFWEREHLTGWRDAADEYEAGEKASWQCPACSNMFGEQQRLATMAVTRIVHRGQEVTADGEVVGQVPRTNTFGLRWTAFDNPFRETSSLGIEEWKANRDVMHDSAERAIRQFIWAIPYEPPDVELMPLDAAEIAQRQRKTKRGEVPSGCIGVVIGCDTGKRELHWSAHAALADGSDVIIDYGRQTTKLEELGVTKALIQALTDLRAYWATGWRDAEGKVYLPSQVWIDSGYAEHQAAVYSFCRQAGPKTYRPTKGDGESVYGGGGRYQAPRSKTKAVRYVGKGMYATAQHAHGIDLMHIDADAWKAEFHSRLKIGADAPGGIWLYAVADPIEHADWSQHVTAERQVDVFKAGQRIGIKWEPLRRANHWLDAGYAGTAAAEYLRATQQTQPAVMGGWFAAQKGRR